LRAIETFIPFDKFKVIFGRLSVAVDSRDRVAARKILLDLVDNYRPTGAIDDLIWKDKDLQEEKFGGNKITQLAVKRAND
jgi:hypothetical protein